MSTIALPQADVTGTAGSPKKRLSPWKLWGALLLAPYVVIFVVFVVYPVGYGLWLARHPESYERLFDDPIFAGSVVNTLVFLIVAINIKMLAALFLSGFFVTLLVYYLLGYLLNRLFKRRVIGTAPAYRDDRSPLSGRLQAAGLVMLVGFLLLLPFTQPRHYLFHESDSVVDYVTTAVTGAERR